MIATVDRPELLKRAVKGVVEQDYAGYVQIVVVHDRTEPRPIGVTVDRPDRSIETIANTRTPGLAGARNSGILHGAGALVAFCDDDDLWLQGKLRAQVNLWRGDPAASAVATGIVIQTADGRHTHEAPCRTRFEDLLRSRVIGLHPSSLLIRRADLLGRVGLVDEELPNSYGEDYELLLRLTRFGDVIALPAPFVNIDWARASYFAGKWDAMGAGLEYILDQVPEFTSEPRGLSRIEGQIAFTHAARGRGRLAMRWSRRAIAHDPRQLRAYAAMVVAARLVSANWLLDRVQRHGRGL